MAIFSLCIEANPVSIDLAKVDGAIEGYIIRHIFETLTISDAKGYQELQ